MKPSLVTAACAGALSVAAIVVPANASAAEKSPAGVSSTSHQSAEFSQAPTSHQVKSLTVSSPTRPRTSTSGTPSTTRRVVVGGSTSSGTSAHKVSGVHATVSTAHGVTATKAVASTSKTHVVKPRVSTRMTHPVVKTTTVRPKPRPVTAPKKTVNPVVPQDSATYLNWAGYQAKVAAPTSAAASWMVPKVSWAGRDTHSNTWVGIGGGINGQGQLIQAGTEQDNVCVAATKGVCTQSASNYFFWVETFPQRTQAKVTNLAVAPGDAVTVKASWNARTGMANFLLCNMAAGQCVTDQLATTAPASVAEFITERPTDNSGTPLALSKFTPVTMSNPTITSNGQARPLASLPNTRITMRGPTGLLATTSPLAKDGSFSISMLRSA